MKLCAGHYAYKSIPDAKFESVSLVSFGGMTSQKLSRKKGMSHQIRLFTPTKLDKLEKYDFFGSESFFSTENWPPSQFHQFSRGGKFLGRLLMTKELQQPSPPAIDQFCQNLIRTCLEEKN